MMKNGYLKVRPVKTGVIDEESHEYVVVDSVNYQSFGEPLKTFQDGDRIIVSDESVEKIFVGNEKQYYVKEEHVIEVLASGPKENG